MNDDTRILFDTNVLVSALIFEHSKLGRAFRLALETSQVLLSPAILEELNEVMRREKFERYVSSDEREAFLEALIERVALITPTDHIQACRDPKDDKFLELATSGRATYVIRLPGNFISKTRQTADDIFWFLTRELSNALKFTDEGHVIVQISRDDTENFIIAVTDTGTGIPDDARDTIFEEFQQVKGSDPQHKGTGLGLPITKGFAQLLGGTISIESKVGVGSTFAVKIPIVYKAIINSGDNS